MEFIILLAGVLGIISLSSGSRAGFHQFSESDIKEDYPKSSEYIQQINNFPGKAHRSNLISRRWGQSWPKRKPRRSTGWTNNYPISSWNNIYKNPEQSHPNPNYPGYAFDGWGWKSLADNKGRQVGQFLISSGKLLAQTLDLTKVYTTKVLNTLIFLGKIRLVPTPDHQILNMNYGTAVGPRPSTVPASGWRPQPIQHHPPPSTEQGWSTEPEIQHPPLPQPTTAGWNSAPLQPAPEAGWSPQNDDHHPQPQPGYTADGHDDTYQAPEGVHGQTQVEQHGPGYGARGWGNVNEGWSGGGEDGTGKGAMWRTIGYGLGSGLAGLGKLTKTVKGATGLASGLGNNLVGLMGGSVPGLGSGLSNLMGGNGWASGLGSGIANLMGSEGGNNPGFGSGISSLIGGGGGNSGFPRDWLSMDSSSVKVQGPSQLEQSPVALQDFNRYRETPTRNLYETKNKSISNSIPSVGKESLEKEQRTEKGFGYSYGTGNEYSTLGRPPYHAPSLGHYEGGNNNYQASVGGLGGGSNFGAGDGDRLAVSIKAPSPPIFRPVME